MAARTMKLVANSLIKLANLVDAKVLIFLSDHISVWQILCLCGCHLFVVVVVVNITIIFVIIIQLE